MFKTFLEAFLPLFVAINLPGIIPLFIGMTEGLSEEARRKLTVQALGAALVLSLLILFAGELIFNIMGITVNDLRVGGGLILLVLSISDLIFGDLKQRRSPNGEHVLDEGPGIVPLGIPLTIGPAAITTILVSQQSYGYLITMAALLLNIALVYIAFTFAPYILRWLGKHTTKAIAKVASLFLAAIAVAMIRAGVVGMLKAL